ncbi:GNAT family N-acetyltransferase [Paenibacillus filicis]|uniref:GNAT family N-acetyltransferase n=1 Tax=Paenibacillus filicis TaxID=669464 RepID=A0ABU9DTJ7_9BACL
MDKQGQARISLAASGRAEEIKEFVLEMMRDLYPPGSYYENPQDLVFFDDVYVRPANAEFFVAENAAGEIVGTAAFKPYDRRFPEMDPAFGSEPVCEIVKCYVHPDYRRQGIGSHLYTAVEQGAREAGYAQGYLHTSLYLPGGYSFWQSRGYRIGYWESDQIVHMSKDWREADYSRQDGRLAER